MGLVEVCDLTMNTPPQPSTSPCDQSSTTEASVSDPPMTPSPVTLPGPVLDKESTLYVLSEYRWRRADDTVIKIRESGSFAQLLKDLKKPRVIRI